MSNRPIKHFELKQHRIHCNASTQTAAFITFLYRAQNLQSKVHGLLLVKTGILIQNPSALLEDSAKTLLKDRQR